MIKNSLAKSLLSATIAAAFAVPMAAHATNGYFLPGYGAKSMGMGGVGVAYAQDSLAAMTNPAGIAGMGFRADLGLSLFNPERRSAVGDAAGPATGFHVFNGQSDSINRIYPIPNAGFTMDFNDKITIGFAMVGNGGMNTTYKPNFYSGVPILSIGATDVLGIDFMQLLMPLTVAYKVDSSNAIGFSLVPAIQTFGARGLQAFPAFSISSDNEHLTNKGRDNAHGAGVRVGWTGKYFDDRLTLGATYASKIYMSRFNRYAGLFAEGGGFDVPENFAFGFALKPTQKMTFAFDLQKIQYAKVASIGNRGPNAIDIPAYTDSNKLLGLKNGMGFGWKNQTVYKYGVDYKYNKEWTFRAGYNYGKSPIQDDQLAFNVLAPATVEKHFTVGFTYAADQNSEFTMSYLRANDNKQQRCGLQVVKCAEIEMYQNALDMSYAWKF